MTYHFRHLEGDPAVLLGGVGVMEPVDPHQQRFPLYQPETDSSVRLGRPYQILHPRPAQVGKTLRIVIIMSCLNYPAQ